MTNQLDSLMGIAGVLECCVPVLSLAAYIPQWRKLLVARNSESISLISWVIWAVAYVISVFYAVVLLQVTGFGWPLVATTALGLCFVLFTMVLVWRFRPQRKAVDKNHLSQKPQIF